MIKTFTFQLFATGKYTKLSLKKEKKEEDYSPSDQSIRNILSYAKSYHVLELNHPHRDIVIN